MKKYILKKTFIALITIFLVLVFVFLAARISGNPFEVMYPEGLEPGQLELYNAKYGLDKGYLEQFRLYLINTFKGDFGISLIDRRPVTEIIFLRFKETLNLGALAFFISVILGLISGLFFALKSDNFLIKIINQLMSILYAVPGFIKAILLMLIFSFHLNILPSQGGGTIKHYILPVICLSLGPIIGIARHVQNSVRETLSSDYIKTAVAMGVGKRDTIIYYAFRNALIPTITQIGMVLVDIIGGSMVIETVFSWPGIGLTLVKAVMDRDYPVMQFSIVLLSAVVIFTTYILDILYLVIDPRIQEKEG